MSYTMKTFKRQSLAMAMAVGLAACGGGDDPAPAPEPTPAPPTTLEQVTSVLKASEQKFATDVPATADSRSELWDACYINNGNTKQTVQAAYAQAVEQTRDSERYMIGHKIENIKVLSEKESTNPDSTSRKEVLVSYDRVHTDGTRQSITQTFISGSSTGTAGCANGENKAGMRSFGNRKIVQADVSSRNIKYITAKIADGSANGMSLRREVRFVVADPSNVATYAVVTGPGPKGNAGAPFSLKLLSPRLARDAAEMQGKVGAATYKDTDNFRFCWGADSNILPDVAYANCTVNGTSGDSWGWTYTPSASATTADYAVRDDNFAAQGWVENATYTFAIYADDGWKTVGGHVGKTPIATYQSTLAKLPYGFAAMNTAPAAYPVAKSSMSGPEIAPALQANGGTTTLTWTQPTLPAGAQPTALTLVTSHRQGPQTGSTNSWPRIRDTLFYYPGGTATTANVAFQGKPQGADSTSYAEFGIHHSDRQGRSMATIWRFQ